MPKELEKNKKLAQEIGQRLKIARLSLGLSRDYIFKKYNIKVSTLGAIEVGANLLTQKRGKELVSILIKEGYPTSLRWLMEGVEENYILEGYSTTAPQKNYSQPLQFDRGNVFVSEINFFMQSKPDSIVTMISDDTFFPIFNKGDFVGGIKQYEPLELQELINKFCIVTDKDDKYFVTKILSFNPSNDQFFCGFVNNFAQNHISNYFYVKIKNAAIVTRHWLITAMS